MTMITCTMYVGEGDPAAESPFKVLPEDTEFHRVPVKGEIVSLGDDKDGRALHYEVVMVVHRPDAEGNVEIYANRVDLTTKLGALELKAKWRG